MTCEICYLIYCVTYVERTLIPLDVSNTNTGGSNEFPVDVPGSARYVQSWRVHSGGLHLSDIFRGRLSKRIVVLPVCTAPFVER